MDRVESRSRSSKRHAHAWWVAAYVLGLFLSTAHFSLVAHRTCEHGEVAHVEVGELAHCESDTEAVRDAGLGEALRTASAADFPAPDEPAPSEDEGHEHCELDPAAQVSPPFELAPLRFAQWLEEHFGPRAEPEPRAPTIAILRQAPGRSPPRA